jgi:hypothetical protein
MERNTDLFRKVGTIIRSFLVWLKTFICLFIAGVSADDGILSILPLPFDLILLTLPKQSQLWHSKEKKVVSILPGETSNFLFISKKSENLLASLLNGYVRICSFDQSGGISQKSLSNLDQKWEVVHNWLRLRNSATYSFSEFRNCFIMEILQI